MKDTSLNDFVTWWADQVATELGLVASDVEAAFSRDNDLKLRTMIKYGWSKGVFGTPTAFVNGVMLDDAPFTVDGWLDLLNDVYDSQAKAPAFYLH